MTEFACCKSSGWLETSQWKYNYCTFSDKACQGTHHTIIQAHTATMETDDHKLLQKFTEYYRRNPSTWLQTLDGRLQCANW